MAEMWVTRAAAFAVSRNSKGQRRNDGQVVLPNHRRGDRDGDGNGDKRHREERNAPGEVDAEGRNDSREGRYGEAPGEERKQYRPAQISSFPENSQTLGSSAEE